MEVKRVSDRLMKIKLVIGGFTLHVYSVYAPQVCLEEKVKARFWENLDEVVRSVPISKKIVITGDFNGHIGILPEVYDDMHSDFGFGVRNGEGTALLEFLRAFKMVWWNEEVKKKVEVKKGVYVKLIESKDEEEKQVNRKVYKVARKVAKLAVTAAKSATLESLYAGLKEKDKEKRLLRIAKVRDRKGHDLDLVNCIK
ncbi:craniofacial development protein 2-like [Capsicum annuum]|uniref:craniofacial development protein 2-like n=1 Tax=Capsicum annuum TaxID=4072 RepID=UPI001FB0E457|nr:craniofacial development protein 2-like [Capsicum annuum]